MSLPDLPDECATESGERVARLSHHKGLIKGEMAAGVGRDGHTIWVPRYWYQDGRLTPARPTPYDLALDVPPEPERVPDPEFYDGPDLF